MNYKLKIVTIIGIVILVGFIFIRPSVAKMLCQHRLDNHKLFSSTENQWHPIAEINPDEANMEFKFCLHRFGE